MFQGPINGLEPIWTIYDALEANFRIVLLHWSKWLKMKLPLLGNNVHCYWQQAKAAGCQMIRASVEYFDVRTFSLDDMFSIIYNFYFHILLFYWWIHLDIYTDCQNNMGHKLFCALLVCLLHDTGRYIQHGPYFFALLGGFQTISSKPLHYVLTVLSRN